MTITKGYWENQTRQTQRSQDTDRHTESLTGRCCSVGSPLQVTVTMRPENLVEQGPRLPGQAPPETLTVKSLWGCSLNLSPVAL